MKYSTFLEKADLIILSNLSNENFSIDFFCRELTTSYTHTYRQIHQATGLSPSRYVCQKRLEKACQLLAETEWNMREIAFEVGFNTQAYFSKCFAERYSCPPLRFRKQQQKAQDTYALALR